MRRDVHRAVDFDRDVFRRRGAKAVGRGDVVSGGERLSAVEVGNRAVVEEESPPNIAGRRRVSKECAGECRVQPGSNRRASSAGVSTDTVTRQASSVDNAGHVDPASVDDAALMITLSPVSLLFTVIV